MKSIIAKFMVIVLCALFALTKTSTPLFSSPSALFAQNTRVCVSHVPLMTCLRSFLQTFRRSTRQPASMSCSACFFSVNPAMMYPIRAGTMLVMILPKCLPVERPKLTRCPAISVTTRPSTFFPTVACHSELSSNAWYSQVKTRLTGAARKISPTSVKMPTSFKSSLRVISPRNPLNPVRKISGINIKTNPKPITTLSMRSAKNRNQNPAYSTRGTAAYPAYAGMAEAPPPTAAVTDVLIIGARGGVGVTTNACPQLEQNAASSGIAPPHLEQYTASPSLNSGWFRETHKFAAKCYFQVRLRSILVWRTVGRQEFHRTSTHILLIAARYSCMHLIDFM